MLKILLLQSFNNKMRRKRLYLDTHTGKNAVSCSSFSFF